VRKRKDLRWRITVAVDDRISETEILYFVCVIATVVAEKEQDSVYEVLFDEEFLGGLTIRSVAAGTPRVFADTFNCIYGVDSRDAVFLKSVYKVVATYMKSSIMVVGKYAFWQNSLSSSSRMHVMNHNWSTAKQRLHPQCSRDKLPFSFVGTGFDNVRHHLGLATRTRMSVCKSPFPSAGTAVSLFRAKMVQHRPLLPREVETRLPDCGVEH